ncbi:hypothetical protein WMY93_027226 [Mugilogobius chulae]|uniref:Regulator of chromosome condensation 2 n=1 Tax=Mugilogobius chulae TaxID=88201 RepID=A0AAW0N2J0_9GOBI
MGGGGGLAHSVGFLTVPIVKDASQEGNRSVWKRGHEKKKTSGKRKERDFSSDDDFDFEQENNKKPGRPATKSGLQPVTVADDLKEKIARTVGPSSLRSLNDIQVSSVVSGPCAAFSLLITSEASCGAGDVRQGPAGSWRHKRSGRSKDHRGLADQVVVAAACGRNHTLALTEDGTAFSFGENKLGQLGQGSQTDAVLSPATLSYNGQPLVKVACGGRVQHGHNSDGKYIARSNRIEFDCELIPRRVALFIEKSKDGQIMPVPNVVVRDVACGANHTLVLDSQKRVFSWGFGGYGRLGHTEQKDEMVPRLVKLFDFPGRGASLIYTGYQCSFAVNEMGGLFFWGVTNTSRECTMYPKMVQDLCGWEDPAVWAVGKAASLLLQMRVQSAGDPRLLLESWDMETTKAKSSTSAQEVKTLDGIYVEQVRTVRSPRQSTVTMGYSHSLAIARQESEQEQEKLKKLPEYNPRTVHVAPVQLQTRGASCAPLEPLDCGGSVWERKRSDIREIEAFNGTCSAPPSSDPLLPGLHTREKLHVLHPALSPLLRLCFSPLSPARSSRYGLHL